MLADTSYPMGLAQSPQPTSRFGRDNDEELLFYMSFRNQDPVAAEEAWAEFYNRHIVYLFGACKTAYFTVLGDLGVGDLVQETFVRAFERAATFKSRPSSDPDVIRRRVRAWLGRIANRLFINTFRCPTEIGLSEMDSVAATLEDDGHSLVSPLVKLIREAIALLSERERHVLRVTADWYRHDREHQRVSKAEMSTLAAQLQTTSVNIRQIRKRAIDKVRAYIESHEQQPGK